MIFLIGDDAVITDMPDGTVCIVRHAMGGKLVRHSIKSEYKAEDIAFWMAGQNTALAQEAFPKMSDADREFLISGITPEEWARIFKPGNEE
jgi:hypothetical protein